MNGSLRLLACASGGSLRNGVEAGISRGRRGVFPRSRAGALERWRPYHRNMTWLREVGNGAQVVRLTGPEPVRFGRAPDNDLVLADDLQVSRHHAELLCRQGTWWVRDRGSHNGTFVNGSRVSDIELVDGDRLRVGHGQFVFLVSEDPMATMDDTLMGTGAAEDAEGQSLSPRESEVLAWVASGATDIQIARGLGIGVSTVQSHLDRIRDKTGRRRRPDLTRLAAEMNLDTRRTPPPHGSLGR